MQVLLKTSKYPLFELHNMLSLMNNNLEDMWFRQNGPTPHIVNEISQLSKEKL